MTYETLNSDPKAKKVVIDSRKEKVVKVKKQPKFQSDIKNWTEEAKVVVKNFSDFIETVSLAIVTGFAIYGALNYELRTEYKYAVLFAGVVVGLRAFNLLHEFLKRK